ncbi:hypothetical protein GCM10009120_04530 [Sphingobacterium siyangense subsp. cladoniae]|uniref:hypothetical protein n=1 Tax=Sphingobacterium siyangense TaxID=459529 RepID=UPI0031F7E982
MEKDNKNIHRGKVLHEILKNEPRRIKDIVEDAGYKYGTFYKHKNNPELSYEIIAKYGKIIGRDLSIEFPEMAEYPSLAVVKTGYSNKGSLDLKNELEELKEKYSNFLNKHNSILESNIQLREENIRLKEQIAELKTKS